MNCRYILNPTLGVWNNCQQILHACKMSPKYNCILKIMLKPYTMFCEKNCYLSFLLSWRSVQRLNCRYWRLKRYTSEMHSLPLKLYWLGPLRSDVIFYWLECSQTTVRCGSVPCTHNLVSLNFPPLLLRYCIIFCTVSHKCPYLLGPRSVER